METATTTESILDTGAMLAAYCKKKKIYKSALARKMGVEYKSIFYYLKTKSMDLQKLMAFSDALGHNFLMDLAAQLPGTYTTNVPMDTSKDEEIKRLKEQIKMLESREEVLLKALSSRV